MANLVVHFEIHASEPQRLIDFYSQLLGWRCAQFGEGPYWSIETGEGAIGNVADTAGQAQFDQPSDTIPATRSGLVWDVGAIDSGPCAIRSGGGGGAVYAGESAGGAPFVAKVLPVVAAG